MSEPLSADHLRSRAIRQSLIVLVCAFFAILPLRVFGPALVDDAYITFRYAENLAAGKGFVFNEADGPILGTSTPLFTLLLAGARRLGFSCPAMALWLSVLGAFMALFLGNLIFQNISLSNKKESLPPFGAILWIPVLAFLPQWVMVQISGMETMLYTGFCIGALWATLDRRYWLAGILAGLATLTRYDGWALSLLIFAWIGGEMLLDKDRRQEWKRALLAPGCMVLLQLPWILYALITFGSYAPHSVAAKQVIHARGFDENALTILQYFFGTLSDMPGVHLHRWLLVFFLAGLVFMILRKSRGLLLLLWMGGMLFGFAISGIMLFRWYLAPALAVFGWISAYGIWGVCELLAKKIGAADKQSKTTASYQATFAAIIIIGFTISHGLYIFRGADSWPKALVANELSYLSVAQWVRQNGQPGQNILTGEVGALSWGLLEYRILDSSGINTDSIYQYRKADMESYTGTHSDDYPENGTQKWVIDTLENYQPEWIISIPHFLHLKELQRSGRFPYVQVHQDQVYPGQPVPVFHRR
ncbi:MAG: ArnT family glycosyltransferase [Candidatus Sumerlaeia bacterium]